MDIVRQTIGQYPIIVNRTVHWTARSATITNLSVNFSVKTNSSLFSLSFSRAIKTNPDVQWSTPIENLFKNDFWGTPIDQSGSHKSYRPLCTLTFKLNHYFHQFDASGYHLVNLVIHCLVCLLFTSLAKRWTHGSELGDTCNRLCKPTCNQTCNQICNQNCDQTQAHSQPHSRAHNRTRNSAYRHTGQPYWQTAPQGDSDQAYSRSSGNHLNDHNGSNELREANGNKRLNAFNLIKQLNLPPIYLIASLLFCLHPIHTEAVAGLVGRADVGCSLFVLLSLHFYDDYLRRIYRADDSTANPVSDYKRSSNLPFANHHSPRRPANRTTSQANFQPLSDLNGRGRAEFKERRLMQLPVYLDATTNGGSPVNGRTIQRLQKGLPLHGNLPESDRQPNGWPPTNLPSDRTPPNRWSADLGARIQLYLAIICAIISVAWKEYGVTVFAICALYHLVVHCGRLASSCSTAGQSLDQSKRLVSPNLLRRRRCQMATYRSKPTAAAGEQDKLSTRPQSKEPSKWRAFVRCLHAILNNVSSAAGWLLFLLVEIHVLESFSETSRKIGKHVI